MVEGSVSRSEVSRKGPERRGVGSSFTPDSILVWLQNYCSQHPLEDFVTAVGQLRHELAAQENRLPKSD